MSQNIFQISGLNSFLATPERRKSLLDKGKYGDSMYYIADTINDDVFDTLLDTNLLVMQMFLNGFRKEPSPNGQCPIPLLLYAMYAFQKEIEHRLINNEDKVSYNLYCLKRELSAYFYKTAISLRLRIKPHDLKYGNDRIYMFDFGDKKVTSGQF